MRGHENSVADFVGKAADQRYEAPFIATHGVELMERE